MDLFDDGRHLLRGTLRLLRSTATTYEVTLSYGASVVMNKLKATRLRELHLGGLRVWKHQGDFFQYRTQLAEHMADVVASPQDYDYVFAPYSNNDALGDNPDEWPRYANFNNWGQVFDPVLGLHEGFQLTTGYVTGYPVNGQSFSAFPDFYPFYKLSCCPSVKLAYLVRTMLLELGIPLEEDFFDAETEQLVIMGAVVADDALIYSKATPDWLFVANSRIDFSRDTNIEGMFLVEYKPKINNNWRLYTRIQALYEYNIISIQSL
ncbi:MAG: hypothetical protein EOO63_18545 [Hymenobacter sp.]|nr:MAG: hypothetical protein EOO63_18545 [Hymenobacter sp.]